MDKKLVKKMIKNMKMTQLNFSVFSNINVKTVNKLYNGIDANMTETNIVRLAKALGVNVGHLFKDVV